MKDIIETVLSAWSMIAKINDFLHPSNTEDRIHALEERIHAQENVITIHQCVIGALSAGLVILFTYILWRKH